MNIVMITENDPAGMGIAFTNAINKKTPHRCRLITTKTRYNFEFEKDIHVPDLSEEGFDEIVHLLEHAEIIHFHILADEEIQLGPIRVKDFIDGKTILHHHHGHPDFRNNPGKYREKYKQLGRQVLVSTPDLLKLLPEATWQPNLVPIEDPLYRPLSDNGNNGSIRICHSPTRKDLKNTFEFLHVVKSLQKEVSNVEPIVVENTLHTKCLQIKQKSDIHFDHMQGYYGVSSLEGLSQGKPVIGGLDEWNRKSIAEFFGTDLLPWISAGNTTELETALRDLIQCPKVREEKGKLSREFMETYWNEERVIVPLIAIYERLLS